MWLILTVPAVLCLLGVVVESGNLWVARVELTNALEAAALAGADEWGDGGANTPAARNAARANAVAFAGTNTVNDQPVIVAPNGGGIPANDNASVMGNVVILGAYDPVTREFSASLDPATPGRDRAVRAQATISVNSIIGEFCGVTLSAFNVSTHVSARYASNSPRIVTVDTFAP